MSFQPRFSTNQLRVLRIAARRVLGFEYITELDQRSLRALYLRGLLAWRGNSLVITPQGEAELEAMRQDPMTRSDPTRPLFKRR